MATSATNSTLKKEKTATPSSHPHKSTRKQGGSRPANPSSGSTNKDNPTTPSAKPIPNYLKPTFSSRPEPLKQVKKSTGHEDTAQKPALLRRRSFDRPPSLHHHAHKLEPSSSDPKERLVRDRITGPVRSSSFSSKNATSPKTAVDRHATAHKPGKSHQTVTTRTMGRSSSLSNKKVTNAPVLPKEPVSHDGAQNLDLESMLESNEESFLAHETEEILNDVSEEQVPSDSPKAENEEVHNDAEETDQVNNGEDDQNLIKGSNINVSASAKPVEETETDQLHQENENQLEGEENNDKSEESINANANPEDEAKVEAVNRERVEENIVTDNAVSDEELVGEEKKHGDMNRGNEGSEALKPQEGQDQVVNNNVHEEEDKAPDAADSTQKKQVVQGSKKESHAAYNDVIEETKNKLLEERKNKVKALVGAFETVIDYESGSK
uniref:Calmodulin-binding domain-containing protein n=1 Tax=Salix viminalis TaxID=40686 RepID=A0A6N2KLZ0_SALVM